ncbi:pilus assembly protein PilM [Patescibacteria group bacterium]|nr:pilus assembly protein PilM [Patescibacteria group bacterium]
MFSPNTTAFGLDISDFAIRLVNLRKTRSSVSIESFNELKVPAGYIVDGEIKDEENVTKLLNKLLLTAQGKKLLKTEVVSVLPETKTFIKIITVKKTEKKELPKAIKLELKKHIPINIEEIYLDWQVISENEKTMNVLAGIAPKVIVDSYLNILRKVNLIPLVLEIEAAAISRALIAGDDKAKIIIDIGAARTGLIVYVHNTIVLTVSLPISGEKVTQEISQTLNIDYQKAEKAKYVCGLDKTRCKGALRKILFNSMDNLVFEIDKAVEFYTTHFPQSEKISQIYLCGGGAYLKKIDKYLSHRIKMEVITGDPLRTIKKDKLKEIKFPVNRSLSYTTAIGLALRGVDKNNLL